MGHITKRIKGGESRRWLLL